MPDSPGPTSSGTPDLSPGQASHPRRPRPPDPHASIGEAGRVPLRAEPDDKARKRESRLGLRNLFGRHRGGSDADRGPASPRDASHKQGGIRASLAEINWPYGLHNAQAHRSEILLSSFTKSPSAGQTLRHKKSEGGVRSQTPGDGIAAWSPPPLFQAYPQAIKHVHLPACTASPEVVLRLHNHKSTGSLAGLLSPSAVDIPEDPTDDKARRRHRRSRSGSTSKFEWTSKVFVLVTAGYLLQYAGEGSYDRLPERVLQLGKDSAAFASDAIPGRHWVLQVSSVADSDRAGSSHSTLRARLPFRGPERKPSSAFLMVFESAEQMDGWIAILRREIEALGGRKVLSETGKPKTRSPDPNLRSQASQRTLLVRDPGRFSRVMTPDQPYNRSLPLSSPDVHMSRSQEDLNQEQSFDDNSTASFISHDGRQLDSLRDSTNRLSLMSSGQRTMLTSVGSSPACSPVRDSFGELDFPMPELPRFDEAPQPRRRPNAKAIIDRRQSLQAMNHVLEMRVAAAQTLRPLYPDPGQVEAAVPPTHTTAKRQSLTKPPVGVLTQAVSSPFSGRMSARRPPPSALTINPRPLSLVEDQPSPASSSLSQVGSGTESARSPLSAILATPPATSPRSDDGGKNEREPQGGPARDSGVSAAESTPEIVLHMDQRPASEPLEEDRHCAVLSPNGLHPLDIPRSRLSLGAYETARAAMKAERDMRRQSFNSPRQIERPALSLFPPPYVRPESFLRSQTPTLKPMPKSTLHLQPDPQSQSQSLPQRRSMSQLTDGPPPAPPPNKALPPIPQKAMVKVIPPPGFF